MRVLLIGLAVFAAIAAILTIAVALWYGMFFLFGQSDLGGGIGLIVSLSWCGACGVVIGMLDNR